MRSIDNLYALSFFTIPLESVCFRSSSRTFSGFATVIRSLVAQQSTSTIFFFPPRPLVISSLTGSPEVAAAAPAVFPASFLHLHQLCIKLCLCIIIFTSRSLEIKFPDHKCKDHIIQDKVNNTNRNDLSQLVFAFPAGYQRGTGQGNRLRK